MLMYTIGFSYHKLLYGLPQWLSSEEFARNAGEAGDAALIPGLGRSPRRYATHSSNLAWRNPWTQMSGGLLVFVVAKSRTQLIN